MQKLLVMSLALALPLAPGCGTKKEDPSRASSSAGAEAPAPRLVGVNMERKVISIGMLNDESGPGLAVGKPYASGKRLLARHVNAGASGLLPDGWKLELIEKDHGYNPQRSVQHFNAIKGDVLFIGTSFGTPNTLPLLASLKRDDLLAFPASLSSQMAENEHTPPIGPSYRAEARRALDWAVEQAGDAGHVKAGIVYQEDDYGKDGLDGWREAAAVHGVSVVAERTLPPGQKDVTAVVSALKDAGATHVLLTVLPSSTGPILGTAHQLQYRPVWIGNTPAWLDRFFSRDVIPPEVFASFYWVTGMPYWGEERGGMQDFLAAWEAHGKDLGEADTYVLMGYVAALAQVEALRRAIEAGDLSRAGYRRALRGMSGWDGGGLVEPLDFSTLPYVVSERTRVLRPIMDEKTWETVGEYAAPVRREPAE